MNFVVYRFAYWDEKIRKELKTNVSRNKEFIYKVVYSIRAHILSEEDLNSEFSYL